jgi:hypothetical protein
VPEQNPEISKSDYDKIYIELFTKYEKEAKEILAKIDDQWKSYSLDRKFSMYQHAMCQMIMIMTSIDIPEDSSRYMFMAATIAKFGELTLPYFLNALVYQEYEKRRTPSGEELNKMFGMDKEYE